MTRMDVLVVVPPERVIGQFNVMETDVRSLASKRESIISYRL